MVVADEDIIGIDCGHDHCIALSGHGGVFRTNAFGDWTPKDSDLPRLRHVYFDDEHILACPEDGRHAWYSQDRGEHWSHLDFPCGADGEPAHLDGVFSVLVRANHFRFGAVLGARYEWIRLPVETVQAVYSDWARLLFFTPDGIVRSDEGEHRFSFSEISVGLRTREQWLAMRRHDRCRGCTRGCPVSMTWMVAMYGINPRVAIPCSIAGICLFAPNRRIVVTSAEMPFGAFESLTRKDMAGCVDARRAVVGASSLPNDLVFATDRGLAFTRHGCCSPSQIGPTLVRATYIQPRVVIGAGLYGGLLRSVDGGETWHSIPETYGFVFVDVVHLVKSIGGLDTGDPSNINRRRRPVVLDSKARAL